MSPRYSLTTRGRQNLIEAMKEEAFAFTKCRMLAQRARKNANHRLARLLEETAEQHYFKHFEEQAELLGLFETGKMSETVVEESCLVDAICKLFAREASEDGDQQVARILNAMHHDETIQRMQLDHAFKKLQSQDEPERKAKHHQRARPDE